MRRYHAVGRDFWQQTPHKRAVLCDRMHKKKCGNGNESLFELAALKRFQ